MQKYLHKFLKFLPLVSQSNQITMEAPTIVHPCIPQTPTPENRADWIMTQKFEVIRHVESIPLTDEEIQQFEHQTSTASMAILELKATKKRFDFFLKKGTPYDKNTEMHKPQAITIQPSKGMDALEANRDYACEQIKKGVKEEVTELYLIPYPETSRMIAVNISGVEWEHHSRDMSADEVNQFKPLLKVTKKETLADTATIKEEKKEKTLAEEFAEDDSSNDDIPTTSELPFGN